MIEEQSVVCLCSAEDEKWVSGGSETVEVGRGHLRKRLGLYTGLVRLHTISNGAPEEI